MNTTHRHAARPSAEARLAAQLAATLTERSRALPHDVTERLRAAREQALSRAQASRAKQASPVSAPVVAGVTARGAAMLGGPAPWWQRAAAILPIVVLVSGLVAIDRWTTREQVMAAADIDAQLLSDSLPPAAYSDPGFAEFLRSSPEP